LENVEGIVSAKLQGDGWSDPAGTPVLLHVLRELERVGYRAEAGLFSASVDAGAPHQRKRVFILAHRLGAGLEGWLPRGPHTEREALDGHLGCGSPSLSGGGHPWPARPGEEQHWWEPPRVLMGDPAESGLQESGGSPRSLGQPETQPELERPDESVGNADCDGFDRREKRDIKQTEKQQASRRHDTLRSDATDQEREGSGWSSLESPLGRGSYGTPGGLGYAKLQVSCDSRADELRLLGNGVVPQCAAVAFRSLLDKVITPYTMTH
jgi:site-specific DNA-cytosine methylase